MANEIIIHKNMSMRDAIAAARDMGVDVSHNAAGEIRFRHWSWRRSYSCNAARHDIVQALVTPLRELAKSHNITRERERRKRLEAGRAVTPIEAHVATHAAEVKAQESAPVAAATAAPEPARELTPDELRLQKLERELAELKKRAARRERVTAYRAKLKDLGVVTMDDLLDYALWLEGELERKEARGTSDGVRDGDQVRAGR